MTNIIGQVPGGTISNGQGCYGASLLPDTFKIILLTLAEDRCEIIPVSDLISANPSYNKKMPYLLLKLQKFMSTKKMFRLFR